MSVINRIDRLVLTEAKIRGFKNKLEMGHKIEHLDGLVEPKDTLKFDKILNKYLDKVDPKSKFDIATAISKLKDRDAMALWDELHDLNYYDDRG